MELHERKELIDRAKSLMDKQGYNALLAIQIAEEELKKEKKEEYEGN